MASADTITKFHETFSDLGMITNDNERYAGIVVRETINGNSAAPFQFNSSSEWNKFVQLWMRAKTTRNVSNTVVGRLKDSAGDSLNVAIDGDGLIEISVAQPAQPGKYELFCDFHLQRTDVAEFDNKVKEISDFFTALERR